MKKKILIIEDYNNIVEILTMRLSAMGYAVICAKDGQEGLTLARKEKPDLIVLDVMLPKMNGYKISRLLKFDSKYKDIPIIMLTSRETKRDEQLCFTKNAFIKEKLTKFFIFFFDHLGLS